MIKNLKELRTNAPPHAPKPVAPAKQPFGRKPQPRQSSEDMDFDDWSEASGLQAGGFQPNAIQKGFFKPPGQPRRPAQMSNGYYDDDFEESDELEALPFNNAQRMQQAYRPAAPLERFAQQQSADVDFDDSNEFDERVSSGQESDDFGDVQLNVKQFKNGAVQDFGRKPEKPVVFENFTDESGFNFEEEEAPVDDARYQTKQVGKQPGYNAPTDKKVLGKDLVGKSAVGAQSTKVVGLRGAAPNYNQVEPTAPRQQPVSAEQFEDTFSDDFTNNVASVDNTRNNAQHKSFEPHKSDVETFKSDFDDCKESFNVDISNIDNAPASKKPQKQVEPSKHRPVAQKQPPQANRQPPPSNYNDINAAILEDRNEEARYLSGKLDENDAYTKKIKDFMEQKTIEYEKLKAKYELLVKDKIRVEDQSLGQRQVLESQGVEIDKLQADSTAKQLVIDELTEKLSARTEELKAKTKLLQERENLFGNSLNEKKLHTNLLNMSRELELARVRIEDFQEAVKRYEQRIVDLEDELHGSPAAIRTKAVMQARIERLLKLLADNGVAVEATAPDVGDLNEDMVYQEMILNGYIKDNKKLIEENKFLKEKLFAQKIEESKSNFDSPAARLQELEATVKRLQEELAKKDEGFKKQAQRYDKADDILMERDRHIETLQKENEALQRKFAKENQELKKQNKELTTGMKELKASSARMEEDLKKAKLSSKKQQKPVGEDKPKLQRNIFSQDDNDFKQDIYSMLNNIKAENKQVQSDLRGLKDTWELKGKLNEEGKISHIAHPKSDQEVNNGQIQDGDPAHSQQERAKLQVRELRAANVALEDRLIDLEQQLADKDKAVRKSEYLGRKWYEERQKLHEIIKNMPKTARDIDFAVLEQKLVNLEKQQKLKDLELQNALKTYNHTDLSASTDTLRRDQLGDWQAEKTKLTLIIKQKNDQIGKFKAQMEALIGEFKKLKAAQIN